MARELEAFSRQAAERAAATGDGAMDALAQRLGRNAEQIRHDLAKAPTRRFGWRLGFLDLQQGALGADDADAGPGGEVRPFDGPKPVADLRPAPPVDNGLVQRVQRSDVLRRPTVQKRRVGRVR